MNVMWIDEPVDATVEFSRGVLFPRLRAVRFRDQAVAFDGPVAVDRTPSGLVYRASADGRYYTIRFEADRQRWVLEIERSADRRQAASERPSAF